MPVKFLPCSVGFLGALAMIGCSPLDFATLQPSEEDLAGEYVLVEETVQRLKAEGYPRRATCIILHQDGSLTFYNIPDCWLNDTGESRGQFDSGTGRWRVAKNGIVWAVPFDIRRFTPDSAYQQSGGLYYHGPTVVHRRPPYELAIDVAASDRGYLGFRRK